MRNLKFGQFSLVALVLAGSALPALAQAPQAPPPLTMKQLKPNVWAAIGGAGGNSTIIVGDNGVIVVDAKQTEAGAKDLLAQIAKITPKPVTTVILTHSDGDHVNGLVAFPAGIKIIAHEGNNRELQAALKAGGPGAPPADKMPNQVIRFFVSGQGMPMDDHQTLKIEGVTIDLWHWDPAHTSGDLAVSLPAEKIVATGDIIATNRADDNPNVHAEKNGSTLGWLNSARGLAGLNAETYIPGHGDLVTKADIERRAAATLARRQKIAQMIDQGKTLDEIKAASPDAPAPGAPPAAAPAPRPAGAGPAPKTFAETVYSELKF